MGLMFQHKIKKNKREITCRKPGWVLLLLVTTLLAACSSRVRERVHSEGHSGGSRLEAFTLERYPIAKRPKDLRKERIYPEVLTRHTLRWIGGELNWFIRLKPVPPAFSEIILKKEIDLQEHRSRYALTMSVRPDDMIEYIRVGLIDGDKDSPRVLIETSLAGYEVRSLRKRKDTTYVLKLSEFPDEGTDAETGDGTYPFDWSDIKGLRVRASGDTIPNREVVVRGPEFKPLHLLERLLR